MKSIGLGAGRVMGKVRHRVCGLQELIFDGWPDSGPVIRTMERIKAEGYMPKLSNSGRGWLDLSGLERGFVRKLCFSC